MDTKISQFIPLVILFILLPTSATAQTNITTDQSALLAFKIHITSDPYGVLENWTIPSSVCNWIGITCGRRHHRVVGLNISNMDLTGTIPPQLGNLSFLVSIDIRSNNFGGNMPQDLVHLRRLRFMRLGYNNFTGGVPSWFSSFPQLELLSLKNNEFTSLNSFLPPSTNLSKLATLVVSFNPFQGEIPKSIGNLQNLKVLAMLRNGFSGSIPSSIMNITSLQYLSLSNNSLQGKIPEAIGNLRNLNFLNLENNHLAASIPLSIFNISTLEIIGLENNYLSGTLPDEVCLHLPVLREFHLSFNQMNGPVPSNISSCPQLQVLSLSYNSFTGTIPQEIGNLKMLQELYLGYNKLTGPIPSEIGKLGNLRWLGMSDNLLTGFLPDDFGNLTTLRQIDLTYNSFTGVIPQSFSKLKELEKIMLDENGFNGPMPSFLFNISTLTLISLSSNNFSGKLPTNIGTFLPVLELLFLGKNYLDGVLPNSISNISHLQMLDLGFNKFTGSIPNSLGDLKFLTFLNLMGNNLTSEPASSELSFITSLTRSRHLTTLGISMNPLNGILPIALGNLSSLQTFYAEVCHIRGPIPNEIGNLSGLMTLFLGGNNLTGVIPSALSKLTNLQRLSLFQNHLTGFIPTGLCEIKSLGFLSISHNQLIGSIPECLGNVSSLRQMYLYSNNLTYGIPASIWSLQDILVLDISSNFFIGSLSSDIGNLKAVIRLNLSMNQFSNDIPNTFGGLQKLVNLSLAYNRFQGFIPESMGSMLSLKSLDLSHNMFSGTIPKSLESLTDLEYFNVSFNKLSGEIPLRGPFENFTSQSFAFNTALCGPPKFQVPSCKESVHESRKKRVLRTVIIVLGIGTLMFIGIMTFLMIKYRWKKKSPTESDLCSSLMPLRISYYELLRATNGYSEDNLLGKGSFGSVYRGNLEDGTILAVKVFNNLLAASSKIFDIECQALRNLRHRNLIKVIGSCSNQDFKALILEYMPNGSLEKWLYCDDQILDLMQRLNIMIDVASALEYLHHGYSTPVVHCDLKPSNILIDENMIARVSDFGITKFLGEEESITHTRTLATLGYMAPEYGLEGRVSTKCDVYSYGVLLLETFTRKRPCDEMFSDEMSLKNWVKDSLPAALSQIIDASLIVQEEMNVSRKLSCVSSVMELALKCSENSPGERMGMKDVLAELMAIKIQFMPRYGGTSDMAVKQV